MGGKQQGIPNGWKLFRIQHHPAEPGATPWGDGQTLNRRTGSLLWVSSHVHCSPLFQSWEEVSSYASHWLVKSNRIWHKIRWENVNIKLFSNAIYQHHKQTNKPKKKVQNKKFLSLYSLSDYSPPVPWAGLSLCPLECLFKGRLCGFCNVPPAYKFTGVQRLPRLWLPDGSDWAAISLAEFPAGPADSRGTLMLNQLAGVTTWA